MAAALQPNRHNTQELCTRPVRKRHWQFSEPHNAENCRKGQSEMASPRTRPLFISHASASSFPPRKKRVGGVLGAEVFFDVECGFGPVPGRRDGLPVGRVRDVARREEPSNGGAGAHSRKVAALVKFQHLAIRLLAP